jgi:ribosome maturation factor RimP
MLEGAPSVPTREMRRMIIGEMRNDEQIQEILRLAEQVANPMGLQVVDARFSQQGRKRTLEVAIHRPGGRIALHDCEEVSRRLDELIEEQTPPLVQGEFLLEVQSPGIERQLKTERELEVFRGHLVDVQAKEKVEPLGHSFRGRLTGYDGERITIEKPQPIQTKKTAKNSIEKVTEKIEVEFAKLISVRLHPEPAPVEGELLEGSTESPDCRTPAH